MKYLIALFLLIRTAEIKLTWLPPCLVFHQPATIGNALIIIRDNFVLNYYIYLLNTVYE